MAAEATDNAESVLASGCSRRENACGRRDSDSARYNKSGDCADNTTVC